MTRSRRRAGFTLVEIMIALVISAMLVGLTLSIFSSMSLAFRTQQNVGELQQVLAAAQDQIGLDARQAGFRLPGGFFIGNDRFLHAPVEIINDADGFGPDELRLYYADAEVQARVEGFNSDVAADPLQAVVVDDASDFAIDAGSPFVERMAVISAYDAASQRYRACVVELETATANVLSVNRAGRLGTANNDQCDEIRTKRTDYAVMIYRFRARAYRIDPTRRELAVLQVSRSGGLVDGDWEDLGIGFTDLQIASRWFVPGNLVPADDGDADPTREWYAGVQQQLHSNPLEASATGTPYFLSAYPTADRPVPLELRVSLALRTHARIDAAPSARTPRFTDPARPTTNPLGDRDAVVLEGVPDASRPPELRGDHVYRYSTIGYDLRNVGGGQ